MADVSGHWSAEEDAMLHELPHAAQLIYLRVMRRFVQRDGVCGQAPRKISERMLIELLTVPAVSGRHARDVVAPTRKTVRHLIGVLVKAGLLVRLPVALGAFVFRLPYAMKDRPVSTRKGQMSAPMSAPLDSSQEPSGQAHSVRDRAMSNRMSNRRKGPPQSKASQEHTSTSACRSTSRARMSVCDAIEEQIRTMRERGGKRRGGDALDDQVEQFEDIEHRSRELVT